MRLRLLFFFLATALVCTAELSVNQLIGFGSRKAAVLVPLDPDDIPGLTSWFDASQLTGLSDGDPVPTWENLTANSDLEQATSGKQPTFKTSVQNGLPAVRFNNAAQTHMVAGGTTDQRHYFVVARLSTSTFSSYNGLIGMTDGLVLTGNSGGTGWYTSEWLNGQVYYLDGVVEPSNTAGMTVTHIYEVTMTNTLTKTLCCAIDRAFVGRCMDGDIMEIVVYDAIVSGTTRTRLLAGLKAKWGTP